MKINKNNYELFFTDYIDNKLNVNEVAELMIFLSNNPNLEIELNEIKGFKLSPNNVIFINKEKLYKKEININTDFENNCIAFIENNLTCEESINFLNEVNIDTKKQENLNYFKLTKVSPDNSIKYNNKKIYRKLKLSYKRKLLISYISSAAAVILFILIFNFISNKPNYNNYDKVNFSYLDNNIIDNVKQMIENLNNNFIPDL